MNALIVSLLFAFASAGIAVAVVLWRRGLLLPQRAILFALCTGLGAAALVFLATRAALLVLPDKFVAMDLGVVLAQVGLPALGILLGCGLAVILAWSALRVRGAAVWALIAIVPLALGAGGILFARTQNLPQPAAAPTPTLVRNPQVLPNFKITLYAKAAAPTTVMVDTNGRVYWAEYLSGKIFSAADTTGDGVADDVRVFAEGYKGAKGLAFRPGTRELYVSVPGKVFVIEDSDGDGTADVRKEILQGLSNFDNEHSTNGIAFGPDGKLYIAAGAPRETQLKFKDGEYLYQDKPLDPLVGGILVAEADGSHLKRYAKGMRNPYDLAFDAQGRLFATDNGMDATPNPTGDELNLVVPDGDYGYPGVGGFPPPWSRSLPPVVSYRAHSSPDGVVVYNGQQFPKRFQGDVFVAIWSDSQRLYSQADLERGYTGGFRGSKIDRVKLSEKDGYLVGESSDFAWDFDHPIDVAVAPDGSMYVADFTWQHDSVGGAIYKIQYTGN